MRISPCCAARRSSSSIRIFVYLSSLLCLTVDSSSFEVYDLSHERNTKHGKDTRKKWETRRFRPAAYLKLAESEYFLVSLCFLPVNPRGFVSVRFSVRIFTSFEISFQILPSRTCVCSHKKTGNIVNNNSNVINTLWCLIVSYFSFFLFMTLFFFIFFCIRWHLWQQPALILAPTITRAGVNVYFSTFSDERLETLRTRILSSLLVRCSNLMASQKKKSNNFDEKLYKKNLKKNQRLRVLWLRVSKV